MSRTIRTAAISAFSLATLLGSAAHAQAQLEEIVVTANRREENIQRVPIAVSAITASSAAGRGVVDLQSIGSAIPGLSTSRSLGSNSPYIRGVGNPAPEIANEPSVATYVDNIYTPTGAGTLFEFNNIDRVEVLKGPQGTLFGRNATGGVIHVITRNPSFTPSMDVNAGYGRFNTWTANLYATAPLSDTIAVNAALHAGERTKGWGRNLITGGHSSVSQDYAGRFKLLFTPTTETSVLLAANFGRSKGAPGLARTPMPGVVVANPPGAPLAHIGGFHDVALTINPNYTTTEKTFSGKIDHDFGAVRLTSITGYSDLDPKVIYDLDISPANSQIVNIDNFNRMFSQEVQLKSPVESKLQWIVGAFYMNVEAGFEPQRVLLSGGATIQDIRSKIDTESLAGFAQGSYEIFTDTRLTAGVRYTRDRREVAGTTAINGVVNPAATVSGRGTTWKKATFRVALDHQFTDEFMGYVSLNTGFKSGVYNPTSYTAAPANPENITAYETGFKSQWLDNRLRLNAAAFWYDYKNLQVTVTIAPPGGGVTQSFTQNAAKATVKGIDLELTALPTENLTITGGLSILDGKYDDYPNGNHFSPRPQPALPTNGGCANLPYLPTSPGGQVSVPGCQLGGRHIVQAPKATFNLAGSYKIPMESGDLNLNLSYFHTAKWFFEPDNSVVNPAHELVNGSIDWNSKDGGWGVSVWGRNLTNAKYYMSGASTSAARYYAAAEPRTYGFTVRAHFE